MFIGGEGKAMAEFTFLGTGAADWDIKDKGGFFRRNSAALVNKNLMLDCGRHIFDFMESSGNPHLYDDVSDIIITHNHDDHYCRESVLKLAGKNRLRVGCSKEVMRIIGAHPNIEYTAFEPFGEYMMGEYKVTALLANHHVVVNENDAAFHYIIETADGKKIFYGLDGAWFLRPSWEVMKKHKFDVMVLDCTVGDMDDWRMFEHNTIPMLRMMMREIQNQKLVSQNGVVIASHMAKTLHSSHEETAEILKKFGMAAAFDGMSFNF